MNEHSNPGPWAIDWLEALDEGTESTRVQGWARWQAERLAAALEQAAPPPPPSTRMSVPERHVLMLTVQNLRDNPEHPDALRAWAAELLAELIGERDRERAEGARLLSAAAPHVGPARYSRRERAAEGLERLADRAGLRRPARAPVVTPAAPRHPAGDLS